MTMPSYEYKDSHYKDKTVSETLLSLSWKFYTWKDDHYIETGPWLYKDSYVEPWSYRRPHASHALAIGCLSWEIQDKIDRVIAQPGFMVMMDLVTVSTPNKIVIKWFLPLCRITLPVHQYPKGVNQRYFHDWTLIDDTYFIDI